MFLEFCSACCHQNQVKMSLPTDPKCFWILRKDEEKFLYDKHAMNLAGEGAALMIGKNYEDFYKKNNLDMVLNLFETENFSYDEYSFPALEIIVSRYYGYVPRVKND